MVESKRVHGCAFFILICLSLYMLTGCRRLPEGTLIKSSTSPTDRYRVNAYLVDGGATTDFAIRAEVVDEYTGKKRNIYWNYHESDADLLWISNDTININGIVLNVTTDMYDFRKSE